MLIRPNWTGKLTIHLIWNLNNLIVSSKYKCFFKYLKWISVRLTLVYCSFNKAYLQFNLLSRMALKIFICFFGANKIGFHILRLGFYLVELIDLLIYLRIAINFVFTYQYESNFKVLKNWSQLHFIVNLQMIFSTFEQHFCQRNVTVFF